MLKFINVTKAAGLGLGTGSTSSADWGSVKDLISQITQIALDAVGGVAIIYLIIGAIKYFTAFGDEQKAQSAKNTILYAIIGVIIIITAKMVIGWVWSFAGTGSAF